MARFDGNVFPRGVVLASEGGRIARNFFVDVHVGSMFFEHSNPSREEARRRWPWDVSFAELPWSPPAFEVVAAADGERRQGAAG